MKKNIIKGLSFFLIFALLNILFLTACTPNNNSTNNTTVSLNMDNYSQYLVLQQEVISSNYSTYTQNNFLYANATQSTKVSALVMQNNTEFSNVSITVSPIRRGVNGENWNAQKGTLVLNYNGSGFIMLSATYNGYESYYNGNLIYQITAITGNVIIKNQ